MTYSAATAYANSLNASIGAMDKSPLDPFMVAHVVSMEQAERDREAAARRQDTTEQPTLRKPGLLGCYVEGVLKFQSRDHEAIYEYAAKAMRKGSNTWVTPVGSFVK